MVTAASLAAIVVVAGVVLVIRAGRVAKSRTGQDAGVVTTTTTPQDAHKASSSGNGSRNAGSLARTPGSPAAARVGERASDGSSPSGRPYTLDVGGYADLQSALAERDRMKALTGFEGWVVDATEGSDQPYRVLLGAYRSHERATAAANMLLNSKTLSGVKVVSLPPRDARR